LDTIKRAPTIFSRYQKKKDKELTNPIADIRARYLIEVKAAYIEHYEEGLLAPNSLLLLKQSISEGLDRADTELYDWNYISHLKNDGILYRLGIGAQRSLCCTSVVNKFVYN
jgi:hypothetical protein